MAWGFGLNSRVIYCVARLVLGVAMLIPAVKMDASDIRLNEIRMELEASTRLIESLAGHQVAIHRTTGPISRAPKAPLIMEDLRIDTEFVLDLLQDRSAVTENRKWFYRELSDEPFSNNGSQTRYDGTQCYGLITTPGVKPALLDADGAGLPSVPANAPYQLVIGPADQTRSKHLIRSLAGMPCSGMDLSLAAVISTESAKILKTDLVDGVKCVHVSVQAVGRTLDAALDPNAGWLPRTYETRPQATGFRYRHRVTEFQQFPVPGTDKFVWFPVRGVRSIFEGDRQICEVELTLEDLRVNPNPDPKEFRIDIGSLPPGVQVHSPEGISYTGDARDAFQKVDAAIEASTELMIGLLQKSRGQVPLESPVRVRSRPYSVTYPVIVAVASILLLIIGIRIARRS